MYRFDRLLIISMYRFRPIFVDADVAIQSRSKILKQRINFAFFGTVVFLRFRERLKSSLKTKTSMYILKLPIHNGALPYIDYTEVFISAIYRLADE